MYSRGDVLRNCPTRVGTHRPRPQTRSKKADRKHPLDQGSGHAPVMVPASCIDCFEAITDT